MVDYYIIFFAVEILLQLDIIALIFLSVCACAGVVFTYRLIACSCQIHADKKFKLCEENACNAEERLQQLKKLGNYKYSKPLTAMFKRNCCFQWRAQDETPKRTANLLLSSSAIGSRLQSVPLGPVITFTPKE